MFLKMALVGFLATSSVSLQASVEDAQFSRDLVASGGAYDDLDMQASFVFLDNLRCIQYNQPMTKTGVRTFCRYEGSLLNPDYGLGEDRRQHLQGNRARALLEVILRRYPKLAENKSFGLELNIKSLDCKLLKSADSESDTECALIP